MPGRKDARKEAKQRQNGWSGFTPVTGLRSGSNSYPF
jgi:hypothetical protein